MAMAQSIFAKQNGTIKAQNREASAPRVRRFSAPCAFQCPPEYRRSAGAFRFCPRGAAPLQCAPKAPRAQTALQCNPLRRRADPLPCPPPRRAPSGKSPAFRSFPRGCAPGSEATDVLDPSMIANPVQERQHVSTPEQEGTMVLDPNMLQHSNSTFEIERSIILIHTEKAI